MQGDKSCAEGRSKDILRGGFMAFAGPLAMRSAMSKDGSTNLFVFCASVVMLLAMLATIFVWMTANKNVALDDAYITYIYGQNLADGFGLRYNISDVNPTEGGSSLLHVLFIAGGALFEIDPLTVSRCLSILGFVLFTLMTALATSRITDANMSNSLSCVVVISFTLLFLSETLRHMTKGMETVYLFYLHGAFFVWCMFFAFQQKPVSRRFQALGFFLGVLIILARPEGFVLAGGLVGASFLARLFILDGFQLARTFKEIAATAIGLAIFLVAYFAWKISYFGDIFPTAYWVKSKNNIFGSDGTLLPGLKHVLAFLIFRWLPLAALAFGLLWTAGARRVAVVCAILVLPSLCIALLYGRAIHEVAGGFRYGHPLTAPLFIAAAFGLAFHARSYPLRYPALYLGGILIVAVFTVNPYGSSFRKLQHPSNVLTEWVGHQPILAGNSPVADALAETGLGADATVLTSAAGIIPYKSKFKAIDWLGLNDEQLSGKYDMTPDEAWAYVIAQSPDVSVSVFPAATEGFESHLDDPGFTSNSVNATLNGRGVRLFKHWDRNLVAQVIWKQMKWYRDENDLGTCFPLAQNWAVFVYVNRASPHYDRLMEVLRTPKHTACDPVRIKQMYRIDIAAQTAAVQASEG